MSFSKNFVRYSLSIGAIELVPEGRKLKSGRVSPYFFNSGLFNTGESIYELAAAYAFPIATAFKHTKVDVIFGPAYKGIPLATAVSMVMFLRHGISIGYAFNRKEVKNHGEGGIIVGCSLVNKKVLIIDDVMTTGTSSGEAVDIIRVNGGVPVGCVIAFDRQERQDYGKFSAVEGFENNYDIPVYPAATLLDLIEELREDRDGAFPKGKETLVELMKYRDQYGV